MTQLKKCSSCNEYNLTDICRKCKSPTLDAHYKFIKIRDVKEKETKD